MRRHWSRSLPALAICLSPMPALADLDPAEATDLLRAALTRDGATLEATVREEPDGALSWTDVTIRRKDLALSTAGLRFSQLPGGEVLLHWTGPFDILNAGAKLFSLNGDGDLILSDEVPGLVKSFRFPDLTGEARPREPEAPMSVAVAVHVRDLSGTVTGSGDGEGFRLDALGKGLDFDQVVKLAATGQTSHGSGRSESLAIRVDGTRLGLLGGGDWQTALDQGAALAVSLTQGASQSESETSQPGLATMTTRVTSEGGATRLTLSHEGIHLASEIGKLTARIKGGMLPLPLSLDADGLAMAGQFPARFPGKAALGITIPRLALASETWALIDPTGGLNHDPSSLRLDLSGQVSMIEPTGPDAPAVPRIDDLAFDFGLSALGAELSAKGTARRVDSLETAEGAADITLLGIDDLAGSLIQAGIAPPEMLEAYVGILDEFARPGASDDDRRIALTFGKGLLTLNGRVMPMPGTGPEEGAD